MPEKCGPDNVLLKYQPKTSAGAVFESLPEDFSAVMLADGPTTDHLSHSLGPEKDVKISLNAFLESLVFGYLGLSAKKTLKRSGNFFKYHNIGQDSQKTMKNL
jgi:hypothetical protein